MGKGRSIVHVAIKSMQSRRSGAEEWQERLASRKAQKGKNMKLAWLCYPRKHDDDDDSDPPVFMTENQEHNSWRWEKVVAIVYAELETK